MITPQGPGRAPRSQRADVPQGRRMIRSGVPERPWRASAAEAAACPSRTSTAAGPSPFPGDDEVAEGRLHRTVDGAVDVRHLHPGRLGASHGVRPRGMPVVVPAEVEMAKLPASRRHLATSQHGPLGGPPAAASTTAALLPSPGYAAKARRVEAHRDLAELLVAAVVDHVEQRIPQRSSPA